MLNYHRIVSIEDQYFGALHKLLQTIFPPEEVLAYELWKEPLEDPSIHVYVAVDDAEDAVVGATEYRYYPQLRVAMTDFTIIGRPSMGIGRFLLRNRERDLMAKESGTEPLGMFAEVYDPYRAEGHSFGGVSPMNPYVRREVLSHIGYKRLALSYVHPSWDHEGQAVAELDLCFLPQDEELASIDAALVVQFLEGYYSALPNKPQQWLDMIESLRQMDQVALQPL